jgi:hypothetical protein
LPVLQQGPGKQPILWKAPVYHTLHHILTNPVYAGAYAFGRRGTTVALAEGRKRIIRTVHRTSDSWEVLIKDHHEGYIFAGKNLLETRRSSPMEHSDVTNETLKKIVRLLTKEIVVDTIWQYGRSDHPLARRRPYSVDRKEEPGRSDPLVNC